MSSAAPKRECVVCGAPHGAHDELGLAHYVERSAAHTALRDQDLRRVVHDLRQRASALTEKYAPSSPDRPSRLVMYGDAGVMEWAASVIEEAISDAK